MPFLEIIWRSIQQHTLLLPGESVVVGVSGGADSMALLHALHGLQHRLPVVLHVATLDHGWRGEAGAKDADYVVRVASEWGLPVTRQRATLADGNQEAVARRARYGFLADVARTVGAGRVAVGHHADDQAETVLMKVLRGAGMRGLGGMRWEAALPGQPDIRLIRPLLGVTRQEIETYCEEQKLAFREDATNKDTTYLRNKIRREVLPYLDGLIDGTLSERLVRLADVVQVESDYMRVQTGAWLAQHSSEDMGRCRADRGAFLALHPAMQRRVIVALAGRVATIELDYHHITQAQKLATDGDTGAVLQFGEGVQMRVDYEAIVFEHAEAGDVPHLHLAAGSSEPLYLGESIDLGGGRLRLARQPLDAGRVLGELCIAAESEFSVRTRQPGDRVRPPGMAGRHRKLSDWMIDRKIPAAHRDRVPLLVADGQIVAVLHLQRGSVMHPYHQPAPEEGRHLYKMIID